MTDTSHTDPGTLGSVVLDPTGDYVHVRFISPAITPLVVTVDNEHRLRRMIRRINGAR